jgi:hypothetical protein
MTFFERYQQETTWHGKALVMEIFHLAMSQREKDWTIAKTAESFQCSVGLASENLRLAQCIHTDPRIIQVPTRYEAIKRIR